jgi:hypothetical protein
LGFVTDISFKPWWFGSVVVAWQSFHSFRRAGLISLKLWLIVEVVIRKIYQLMESLGIQYMSTAFI